jgi:predicted ATP-grasp superfamily ATP-dependent carboligase
MQTILIELKDNKAFEELHNLEEKNLIRIVSEDFSSYSLPGKPINEEEFRAWVEYAENTPTVSLNEAKQRWEAQKKKLQNLIR